MSREDQLREALDKVVEEFKQYDSNPSAWLSWLVYLLSRLQSESQGPNPVYKANYDSLLNRLQDAIRNHMRTGGW
jgi:hypothetical protein